MVFFMWWPGASLAREGYQNYVTQVGIGMALVLVDRRRPRADRAAVAADAHDAAESSSTPRRPLTCHSEGIAPDDAASLHDAVSLDERADATR